MNHLLSTYVAIMSGKRLNKRQLREQQELQELADVPVPPASTGVSKNAPFYQLVNHVDTDSYENEQGEEKSSPRSNASKKPTATSLFAALRDSTHDHEDAEDQQDSDSDHDITSQQAAKSSKKKNKKKKKKAAAAIVIEDAVHPSDDDQAQGLQSKPQQPKSSSGSKKSSKKKSASALLANSAASKDVSEMSIDEFDQLLASQASLNSATTSDSNARAGPNASSTLNRMSAFRTHLSLDPRNLDPAVERAGDERRGDRGLLDGGHGVTAGTRWPRISTRVTVGSGSGLLTNVTKRSSRDGSSNVAAHSHR